MSKSCNSMDCSTPGFPVHHCLPEFAQTQVHWVSDAIQPSHPLSSSSPAFNLSSITVFPHELALGIRWPKYWSFSISPSNEYSGLISFRVDWFDLHYPESNQSLVDSVRWSFSHRLVPPLKFLCEFLPHAVWTGGESRVTRMCESKFIFQYAH